MVKVPRLSFVVKASTSALLLVIVAQARADCLPYEPATVTLAGKLERKTFPGRPNYESVAKGDEAETGYYLVLRSGICTVASSYSPEAEAKKNIRLIQIVLDKDGYTKLRPDLGRTVRLRGQLFAEHTGHHHAPLLLRFEGAENDR